MEGGHEYITSNAFAGSVLQSAWRVVINGSMWALSPLLRVSVFHEEIPLSTANIKGEHIWLMRGGGWGDLLMMTPLIRRLQEKGAIVHVAMGAAHAGIFDGMGVVEDAIPIDVLTPNMDFIASYEGWIEGHPNAESVHMAQHFADKFDIDLGGEYKPFYRVTPEEATWATKTYPRGNKKRTGMQWLASSLYRSYPHMNKVAEILIDQGCEVFMFGAPKQFKLPDDSPIVNLTQPGLTFRQSAAVLQTCDSVIAPDSAMVHVASALDIPCVGLYGAFPAKLRGSGDKFHGIQGMAPCSPCFYHANRPTDFPAGMPCQEKNYCVAINQIDPKQIAKTALNLSSPVIRLPDDLVK